jgi:hypothetical protein
MGYERMLQHRFVAHRLSPPMFLSEAETASAPEGVALHLDSPPQRLKLTLGHSLRHSE